MPQTRNTNWEAVSHFKADEAWVYISDVDVLTLKDTVAHLLPSNTLDEQAKKFDVLILAIELGTLSEEFDASKAITTWNVVNDYPFDEQLGVFNDKMIPLKKYIDTVHGVVNPRMQG